MKYQNMVLLLVIIIFGSAGLLWRSKASVFQNQGNTVVFTDDIFKDDFKKLEKNIKPEITNDENWKNINDYSISIKNLVNVSNAKHLFQLVNGGLADLQSCLKKDFCGMETRDSNDSYFDASKTPGHILLGRSLGIIIEVLRIYPELQNDLDWNLIKELTNNQNEEVQTLSIELIKDFDLKNGNSDELFKFVENYKGNAKASALVKISNNSFSKERVLFINLLEKSFAIDDPNTVISIVEKLSKMNLSKDELEKLSLSLCHYKENGTDAPNWKMLRYDMQKTGISLEDICL